MTRPLLLCSSLALAAGLAACSPQSLLLKNAADSLALQGQVQEDDLVLARDAAPFYLKLSEGVLLQTPGHVLLAVAVSSGFTQYAYAFVAFEADKLESQDAKAARQQRLRAARLYSRAQRHAIAALNHQTPGFSEALAAGTATLTQDQVALAYWAAAAWGASISLSKDTPEAVADLPQVRRLAELAWRLDPAYGEGALSALLGTLEASRPGGQHAVARQFFQSARTQSQDHNAGVLVAEAEAAALDDRGRYEQLLREALAVALAHRNLANEVMRARAQWLLDTADERF